MALRFPQPGYRAPVPKFRLSIAQLNVPIQHYVSSTYTGLGAALHALKQYKFNTNAVAFRIDTDSGVFVAQGTRHYFQGAVMPFNVCGDPQVVQALKQDPTLAV